MNRSRPQIRTFTAIPRPTTPPPTWTPDESTPLPPALDMGRYALPAVDQGPRGSTCVCHATTYHLDALRRFLGYSDVGRLSRLFVNYWAELREKEARPGHAWQDGIAVEDAFRVLVEHGCPPEQFWPYVIGREHDKPPDALTPIAFRNRITGFASLSAAARNATADKYGPAGSHYDLHLLKRAIQQRAGFVFAFAITGDGMTHDAAGFIHPWPGPTPPGSEAHCVLANGYDDAAEAVTFLNSWGPGWGFTETDGRVHGRGRVRYGDILRPEWAYSMTVATGINGRR